MAGSDERTRAMSEAVHCPLQQWTTKEPLQGTTSRFYLQLVVLAPACSHSHNDYDSLSQQTSAVDKLPGRLNFFSEACAALYLQLMMRDCLIVLCLGSPPQAKRQLHCLSLADPVLPSAGM